MLAFQQYQQAFTAHIRNPKLHAKPARVNNKRMAVYREIVFNNILGSVSACFPVCQQVLGKRKWQQLCRHFFANHPSHSPLFREIPEAFLHFINTLDLNAHALPPYLTQLAHYEWAELAVSHMPNQPPACSPHCNLLDEQPILNPAHLLLAYDYPVHTISTYKQPTQASKTHLLLFRNKQFKVQFMVINALTYQLLQLIALPHSTGKSALTQIANTLQHPQPEIIFQFGLDIFNKLIQQEAMIGSRTTTTPST
jgi:hypothetical protein